MSWNKFMQPLGTYWTEHCDAQAKAEGWALFEGDNQRIQIQRLDESEQLSNDGQAYQLVCQKAFKGSKIHLLALYLDGQNTSEEIYVPKFLVEK